MAKKSRAGTGNYWVLFTQRDPETEEILRGGYPLKTAKDYARITSQFGDPTEVYRGKPKLIEGTTSYRVSSGKRIRRYEGGNIAFPLLPMDLVKPYKFTKAEVPTAMRQYQKPLRQMAANPVVGLPQPTKTLQVIVHRVGKRWAGDLASKHKDMLYREMLMRSGAEDAFKDFALVTFPSKPKLTASQVTRLKEEGKVTIRMDTPELEEMIDDTWGANIFPWAANPKETKTMTRDELLRTIYNDSFAYPYVEAALWSSTDESDESGGDPLDENYELEDFTVEGLQKIIADCEKFLNMRGVDDAIESDYEQAGHDFWLTRNGHGAGFWDGDWPEPEATLLTAASEKMGEVWIYVGDNGRLYFS